LKRKIILELRNLNKRFGGVRAVDGIDMKLYEKEIVAIVGDNGAGKSTLIKIISGVYKKNSGEIYINGKKVIINSPSDAKKYCIETVYQDQGVIPLFNAYLNLFLGREKIKNNILGKIFKSLDFNYMNMETIKLLERIGVELADTTVPINSLSGGQRQSLVVGRAVYWGGKILIFDEPTNNLGIKQERKVIELIKKIRNQYGISIIIISHNISNVFEMVDRIVVLRSGKVIGERIKNNTEPNEIISMITGL